MECGCIHQLTPEEVVRAMAQREHAWKESLLSRYDLDELLAFLRKTIVETKQWNGLDLSTARVESAWTIGDCKMYSGDWYFGTFDIEKDDFILSTNFLREGYALDIKCIREGKNKFRIVSITSGKFSDEIVR